MFIMALLVVFLSGCDVGPRGIIVIDNNNCSPRGLDSDVQLSQAGDGVHTTCVIKFPVKDKDGKPIQKVRHL